MQKISPRRLEKLLNGEFNTMDGWVKLYRQIRQWRWYSDSNVKSLFIHCLLAANTTDADWHEITIKKGTFVTSLASLSVELGLSLQKLRTAIKKLESSGEIVTKSTNKFTIITICKWESYQCSNDTEQQTNNKQITNNQQTNNKQITTNKNNKNKRIEEGNNIDDSVAFATTPTKPSESDFEDEIRPNQSAGDKLLVQQKNCEKRAKEFAESLRPYLEQYGRDMLNEFYLYWTERNKTQTKMRFEMQKTFDIGRRLSKWNKNNFNFNKNGTKQQQGLTDEEIISAVAGGFALHYGNQQGGGTQ